CANVVDRKNERVAVVELYEAGMKSPMFSKATGFKLASVYRAVKRFKKTGGIEHQPQKGRPVTALIPENIQEICCQIQQNSELLMRIMAREARNQ
ncbi:hypothetical protein KIN20_013323, partial [Parelaphostrongylus tenuis]